MSAVAYCDRGGRIGFCEPRRQPKGMLVFAIHRDIEHLKAIDQEHVAAPGVTRDGADAPAFPRPTMTTMRVSRLVQWRDWAFSKYRTRNGAALITDDAPELAS